MTDIHSTTAMCFPAMLTALAKAEGSAQNSSISGEVEHWARLGMALEVGSDVHSYAHAKPASRREQPKR